MQHLGRADDLDHVLVVHVSNDLPFHPIAQDDTYTESYISTIGVDFVSP